MVQWLRIRISTAGVAGVIPGWGTKIPHAMWCDQEIKKIFLNCKAVPTYFKIPPCMISYHKEIQLEISYQNKTPYIWKLGNIMIYFQKVSFEGIRQVL